MRSISRTLITVVAASLVVGILAADAVAVPLPNITDKNDTPGLLDVQRLKAIRATGTSPLTITIKTFEGWKNTILQRTEPNRIYVYFNVDSDHKAEYRGRIVRAGKKLVLNISGSGSKFESLPVKHPNPTTIVTTVPGGAPMNPNGPASIRVKTIYKDTGACTKACVDRVPDHGWMPF